MAKLSHEKDNIAHREELDRPSGHVNNEADIIGFEAEEETLPKGYSRSYYFIGF
jgi:hypothetical protein